jgi:hypothetical protein
VMMIIAAMVAVAIPSVHVLKSSYESTGTQSMISSAFASARAMAAQQHRYAGVRFQKMYDPNDPTGSVIDAPQYMVFIVYDTAIGPGQPGNLGCRAVEGVKPVKLPENLGVVDIVPNDPNYFGSGLVNNTSFSVLFSPTGKVIIHSLWVRNNGTEDEVFNNRTSVQNGTAMFVRDETADIELSVGKFIIYDKKKLKAANPNFRWRDYLSTLPVVYINQYTGTMIEK